MSGASQHGGALPHYAGSPAQDATAGAIPYRWLAMLGLALVLLAWLVVSVVWLLYDGIEVWGNNIPVVWALDIVSYDFWMGIACGALITAAITRFTLIGGRDTITRLAETVALFSACTAAIYPIIHLGRPWFFYWTLPYPNSFHLWPQFRSPLVWDAFDILGFLVVSATLWFLGMLPDLAIARDRVSNLRIRQVWGVAALGWRGEAAHWMWWQQATRSLAVLGIISAVLVQSGASVMYAGSLEPGWHDTLLPVASIVGATLSGLGAITIVLALRDMLWPDAAQFDARHRDLLGLALAAVSLAAIYCYAADLFFTGLGGDRYERALLLRRFTGEYCWMWWLIVGGALLTPQLLWLRALRQTPWMLIAAGALAVIGIWADHAMTIITSLHHDYLPSSVHHWAPTGWSIGTFAGTIGLFLLLLLGALRWLPRLAVIPAVATGDG